MCQYINAQTHFSKEYGTVIDPTYHYVFNLPRLKNTELQMLLTVS